jgi:hypothetical protein
MWQNSVMSETTTHPEPSAPAPGVVASALTADLLSPDALSAFETARRAVSALSDLSRTFPTIDDESLIHWQTELAGLRRGVQSVESAVAGEVGHRSRRDLGHDGLAQRAGFRSPHALVQHVTGSTAKDAATLVDVGEVVREATTPTPAPNKPWLTDVGAAVAAGTLSVDKARAIATGLGEPSTSTVTPGAVAPLSVESLTIAARQLLDDATTLDADQLARHARELRDELDLAGIADRETRIREQRGITRRKLASGVTQIVITPDLETDAFLRDLSDRILAPRRTGVRFTDPTQQTWAHTIATDPRTDSQYLHDAITDLIRHAATADSTDTRHIVGITPPAVRVHVSLDALQTGAGAAHLENSDTPISIPTARRLACTTGVQPIIFDSVGHVLDLGRAQRLFTPAQRIALAARDGGCRVDGCTTPASRTEAHHINHWAKDTGNTNIADGILLCRFHHLLLHNNNWEIHNDEGEYTLIPPPDVDPTRAPRPMPTKNPAQHDLHRQQQAQQQRAHDATAARVQETGTRPEAPPQSTALPAAPPNATPQGTATQDSVLDRSAPDQSVAGRSAPGRSVQGRSAPGNSDMLDLAELADLRM